MTLLRPLHRYGWLLFFALVGAAGFGWRAGAFQRMKTALLGGPPVIEYPAVLDLGERTANELVTSRFEIANRGGQELVINQVKASCQCGKLEREIDGRSEVIEQLRLAPGERADMVVHTTIRTDSAGTFSQMISFLTNDPNQPEGQITLLFRTTSGGLRVYPNAVQFGRLLIGQKTRQVVEVLDRDQPPQTVTKVMSMDPERVAIRWIPAAENGERRDEGLLLGRIEAVPNTAQPLLLDTALRIEFADPKIEAAVIQVSGRVTSRLEVTPRSVVLPMSSGSGPVYTRNCLVRGSDNRPLRLQIQSASPGLTATLLETPKGATRVIRITWTPTPGEKARVTEKMVRLQGGSGAESETLEIPVSCERQ